jgi:hypothetical protein
MSIVSKEIWDELLEALSAWEACRVRDWKDDAQFAFNSSEFKIDEMLHGFGCLCGGFNPVEIRLVLANGDKLSIFGPTRPDVPKN